MAVNLNTVWATVAGVFVFGGTLTGGNMAGVALSLGGTYLHLGNIDGTVYLWAWV